MRARRINEAMKLAAVFALSELARRPEPVPEVVRRAYPRDEFEFGPEYIIPKPFDPRVLLCMAPAVARAAMESGVARTQVDLERYALRLAQISADLSKARGDSPRPVRHVDRREDQKAG